MTTLALTEELLGQPSSIFSVRFGDVLDELRRSGKLDVGSVPSDVYEVVIDDVRVYEDALQPTYHVLSGPQAGARFTGTKLNCTTKGVRRFTKILHAWGVVPNAESTLEELASELHGRHGRVAVETSQFHGNTICDIKPQCIELLGYEHISTLAGVTVRDETL